MKGLNKLALAVTLATASACAKPPVMSGMTTRDFAVQESTTPVCAKDKPHVAHEDQEAPKLAFLTRGGFITAFNGIAGGLTFNMPEGARQGFGDVIIVKDHKGHISPIARSSDGVYHVRGGVTLLIGPTSKESKSHFELCVTPEALGGQVPDKFRCVPLTRTSDGDYRAIVEKPLSE